MTEQEAAAVKAALEAAHPALEWVLVMRGGHWQVGGRDPHRNRSAHVAHTARAWCVMLSLYGEWVSDEFERRHVNPHGATGWSEQSASAAMDEAIASLHGRWESEEVDRAWWVAALKEYRAELVDALATVDERLGELGAQAADGEVES